MNMVMAADSNITNFPSNTRVGTLPLGLSFRYAGSRCAPSSVLVSFSSNFAPDSSKAPCGAIDAEPGDQYSVYMDYFPRSWITAGAKLAKDRALRQYPRKTKPGP